MKQELKKAILQAHLHGERLLEALDDAISLAKEFKDNRMINPKDGGEDAELQVLLKEAELHVRHTVVWLREASMK